MREVKVQYCGTLQGRILIKFLGWGGGWGRGAVLYFNKHICDYFLQQEQIIIIINLRISGVQLPSSTPPGGFGPALNCIELPLVITEGIPSIRWMQIEHKNAIIISSIIGEEFQDYKHGDNQDLITDIARPTQVQQTDTQTDIYFINASPCVHQIQNYYNT